jgi:hypothetical protein
MSANDIILKKCMDSIAYSIKIATCDHAWYSFGFGYRCHKCDHYTGMDTELNLKIKAQLKRAGHKKKDVKK